MQNQTSQDQSVFCLLDWILRYTLFHTFDTLGSHLREEGSLGYDGGLVRLRVQTKLDTTINRQQSWIVVYSQGSFWRFSHVAHVVGSEDH
jgi:hypothetical protein